MKSSRPYLIRALYEWIVDSGCTPYVVVATSESRVQVPEGYAEDGKIVLNIAPHSIRNLAIDDGTIVFDGRFGGRPFRVSAPIGAVLAIYARENGQGMAFEAEPGAAEQPSNEPPPPRGPGLRVVR